jgi:HEAT repeat protein
MQMTFSLAALLRRAAPALFAIFFALALAIAPGAVRADGDGDGKKPAGSGETPTVEELLRVSLERRAAAEARVRGVLDEVFRTLEANPPGSAVAVAARERLTGEAFSIAVPELLAGLEKPSSNLARSCALRLREAATAAPGSLPRAVVEKLVEILKGGSARAKTEAFVVARALTPAEIGPTLRELAGPSDDPGTRREAIAILKAWRDPEALPAFRAALAAKDDEVTRRLGIEALVALGDRSALPAIEPLVADPNHDVRKAAYAALGALGSESVLPTLYSQLDEILRDPDMRQGARIAGPLASAVLDAIGTVGSPESLEKLRVVAPSCPESVQNDVRAACGRILAKILSDRRTDALPLVRPFMDEANPAIRDLAMTIVGAFADKESIPKLLDKLESQNPGLLKKVAETLGAIGERNNVAHKLRNLLKPEYPWEVRVAAALALGGGLREYSGVADVLIKPYEERLRENRNDVEARLALARNYKLIAKPRDAISEYREALKMRGSKDEGEIHLQIAACYAMDGKVDEGRRELDRAKSRGADVEKALAERSELAPLKP